MKNKRLSVFWLITLGTIFASSTAPPALAQFNNYTEEEAAAYFRFPSATPTALPKAEPLTEAKTKIQPTQPSLSTPERPLTPDQLPDEATSNNTFRIPTEKAFELKGKDIKTIKMIASILSDIRTEQVPSAWFSEGSLALKDPNLYKLSLDDIATLYTYRPEWWQLKEYSKQVCRKSFWSSALNTAFYGLTYSALRSGGRNELVSSPKEDYLKRKAYAYMCEHEW